MRPFDFAPAATISEAASLAGGTGQGQTDAATQFLAGGTTLIDLMKLDVLRPRRVVGVGSLRDANSRIEVVDGELRLGGFATMAAAARHPRVVAECPAVAQSLALAASAQLRNMATLGGNVLQKTRCTYYRDPSWSACNKRVPGSGCAAIGGVNRSLAVLGTSDHCIATNPSDQNVALAALEATVHVTGTKGERSVPIADFFLLPGTTPHIETVLEPGDLITSITLPPPRPNTKSLYLKLRDRASYEFALASAAVVIGQNASGHIDHIRVALGGVGTRPWRSLEAEKSLLGKTPTAANLRAAADAALAAAKPQSQNGYKIELAKRCLTHAITQATSSV
jgi:xanthine dehydrogenase YagS FAD-binding subunit